MRKFIVVFSATVFSFSGWSQGVKIGSPGSPDPSSLLELESTSQGFLTARMTTAERDAMASPASGLLIFNTDTDCFNYRIQDAWFELCGTCTPDPSPSQAGTDQLSLTGTTAVLAANTPVNGSGSWLVVSGSGGSFSSATDPSATFTGVAGNSYSLRWTISTACGTSQDDVAVSFVSPFTCGSSTVNDASGNAYNTVLVGSQCWMKSNLRTAKYGDGSDIPSGYMVQWGVGGAPSCNASNFNALSCGVLYDGNVLQNSVSPCPAGWHLPTRAEFETLYTSVSNNGRRLFHPSAGCPSSCSGFDLYICGQNYVGWEGCGSGDQIYLWTRPNSGNNFTSSWITQYDSGSGAVNYNAVQSGWLNYNYSMRCLKD